MQAVTITEKAKDYLNSVANGDYVTELGGSYLAVKNPSSSSSCGCGESFGM